MSKKLPFAQDSTIALMRMAEAMVDLHIVAHPMAGDPNVSITFLYPVEANALARDMFDHPFRAELIKPCVEREIEHATVHRFVRDAYRLVFSLDSASYCGIGGKSERLRFVETLYDRLCIALGNYGSRCVDNAFDPCAEDRTIVKHVHGIRNGISPAEKRMLKYYESDPAINVGWYFDCAVTYSAVTSMVEDFIGDDDDLIASMLGKVLYQICSDVCSMCNTVWNPILGGSI